MTRIDHPIRLTVDEARQILKWCAHVDPDEDPGDLLTTLSVIVAGATRPPFEPFVVGVDRDQRYR